MKYYERQKMWEFIIIGVAMIVGFVLGFYQGERFRKQTKVETPQESPLISLYKDSISDMRKQAKLDTLIKESEVREDSSTNWRIIESKAIKTDTGRANKIKRFMEINYRK